MINTKSCFSSYYNGNESYFYVTKTENYKSKAKDNICWYNFCLRGVSKDFAKNEQIEI